MIRIPVSLDQARALIRKVVPRLSMKQRMQLLRELVQSEAHAGDRAKRTPDAGSRAATLDQATLDQATLDQATLDQGARPAQSARAPEPAPAAVRATPPPAPPPAVPEKPAGYELSAQPVAVPPREPARPPAPMPPAPMPPPIAVAPVAPPAPPAPPLAVGAPPVADPIVQRRVETPEPAATVITPSFPAAGDADVTDPGIGLGDMELAGMELADEEAKPDKGGWERKLYRLFKPARAQARTLGADQLTDLIRRSVTEVRSR